MTYIDQHALNVAKGWAHCYSTIEVCGVFATPPAGGPAIFLPLQNHSDNPDMQFIMWPEELVPFVEDGYELLTIMHSHPNRTTSPSKQDTQNFPKDLFDWGLIYYFDGWTIYNHQTQYDPDPSTEGITL